MMKLAKSLYAILAMCLLLTACTTDDIEPSYDNTDLWSGSLADAPYESAAICLEPTGAMISGRAVNYIELSGSGLYYITSVGNEGYSMKSFRKSKSVTRDWLPYESVISGEFTILDENRYKLDGFGIMTLNPDGTIKMELEEGESYIWPVTKVEKINDSALNSRLCRTWNLVDGRIDFLNSKMEVIYSLPISESVMGDEYIYAITFTSAGRVYRKDSAFDGWYGGNWSWSDMSTQLVHIVSDDPSDGAGIFQVLFKNANMQVMNPYAFEDGEDARWEFSEIPGYENIPVNTRYAREYINLKAMN